MPRRQTRNVSLPPHQDAFVEAMVSAGRYRTASEVVRDGLRLLEEAEHRRLLEAWLCRGLSKDEERELPAEVRERAREHFQGLLGVALDDVKAGRVSDGPAAMERLRAKFEVPRD
ncbi:MAG: type II toxin-antitoxin system ParD family antitoxin [Planctomycetota bacterium]|jgi:putative addiction module CopG family antidote